MSPSDSCCTLVPYFRVSERDLPAFRALCHRFVLNTQEESGCLYYGFTFNGAVAHCREGCRDADSVLKHLSNVGPLLEEALQISKLIRLEIHGPESEVAKLRVPLAGLNPEFFIFFCGFRRG